MAVIGSRPGDDVSKTAERNLHGGTKVWSALHTEIPGPMKCCSLRIGLPIVVQENRAGCSAGPAIGHGRFCAAATVRPQLWQIVTAPLACSAALLGNRETISRRSPGWASIP